MQFQPAIPTRGTKVPANPEWIHEVKYDGHRQRAKNSDRIGRSRASLCLSALVDGFKGLC
jgi:hypothetical protein